MSSVVNKSGTRFAPKVRQRRVIKQLSVPLSAQKTLEPEIKLSDKGVFDDDDPKSKVIKNISDGNKDHNVDVEKISFEQKLATDNQKDLTPSETSSSTESRLSTSSTSSLDTKRRRSSRLNSLSNSNSQLLFKPIAMQSSKQQLNTTAGETVHRRLSTISNPSTKKSRMSSIPESDDNLITLKKSRMSTRISISKKSGSVHRISIVPVENNNDSTSSESSTSNSDKKNVNSKSNMKSTKTRSKTRNKATKISFPISRADLNKVMSDDLFPETEDKYKSFKIKNLGQIPKNIDDGDSEKYTIDEDQFTMAELCKHLLPIGKPSENFKKAKEADDIKVKKRIEKREIRKRAREEFKSVYSLTKETIEQAKEERKKLRDDLLNSDIPDLQPSTIQLKLNKEGTIAVDDESIQIDRHKNASYENSQKEKVDENPFENLCNSATYGRNSYTDPWTSTELIKFYKALTMWGTDFNVIAQLFPYRTRKQIKAKFINEEKKHPIMIELALRSRLPPDFDTYCDEIRKKLGSIDEFNDKLEKLQVEHEEHLKEIEDAKELAKNEDLKISKSKDINKKTSGGFMTEDLKSYRKSEIVLGTIDDRKNNQRRKLQESVNFKKIDHPNSIVQGR
ncbi:hypothetical protein TPHA_0C03360 [Tetrapisispora phaffii CBS 4417]|uniref:Myb-like domain-containing protein n=1 Tax=Tetrapisispora phaffii (strain ATCC 24235 / CBS 4417 / NBRC 1672 / NRRL Y-8282 / UCD 70-5) TaxID=1071381 RepID=G8BRW2_TETPH|nr:hypothetical protein TPHA_0C03360 [Tetrapisispora phaffii CBS 4417]CCE62488.1 hypothetical protein TPHA_0C03360 [Tetrapisispora phaffii CBS 4417]